MGVTISPITIRDAFFWEIRFPFSWAKVNAVKEIPGRRYDPERKVWTIPGSAEEGLIRFLEAFE